MFSSGFSRTTRNLTRCNHEDDTRVREQLRQHRYSDKMSCGEPSAVFKSTYTFTASVSGKRCEAQVNVAVWTTGGTCGGCQY